MLDRNRSYLVLLDLLDLLACLVSLVWSLSKSLRLFRFVILVWPCKISTAYRTCKALQNLYGFAELVRLVGLCTIARLCITLQSRKNFVRNRLQFFYNVNTCWWFYICKHLCHENKYTVDENHYQMILF